MKSFLLTRSRENNQYLKDYLTSNGFNVYESPLISYEPYTELIEKNIDLINNSTLIVTSNYAAKIIASAFANEHNQSGKQNIKTTSHTQKKCYIVGKESANILNHAGFQILGVYEDVSNLKTSLSSTSRDNLLYLRGEEVFSDLDFVQNELVIYKSKYVNKLEDDIQALLTQQKIEVITIFSQGAANAFLKAISAIVHDIKNCYILCFSKNIAAIFLQAGFKNILYPEKPNIENFLELIMNDTKFD